MRVLLGLPVGHPSPKLKPRCLTSLVSPLAARPVGPVEVLLPQVGVHHHAPQVSLAALVRRDDPARSPAHSPWTVIGPSGGVSAACGPVKHDWEATAV